MSIREDFFGYCKIPKDYIDFYFEHGEKLGTSRKMKDFQDENPQVKITYDWVKVPQAEDEVQDISKSRSSIWKIENLIIQTNEVQSEMKFAAE